MCRQRNFIYREDIYNIYNNNITITIMQPITAGQVVDPKEIW